MLGTLLVTSLLAACGDPDPRPHGEPAVDIGFYVSRTYVPLTDGDECPVIHGLQGGTWTMPAIRTQGIAAEARVKASLVTADGEKLGSINQRHTFLEADDSWFEIRALPIPAAHEAPNEDADIDDLFGQDATLSCEVIDDDGNSELHEVMVVLSQG